MLPGLVSVPARRVHRVPLDIGLCAATHRIAPSVAGE